MDSSGKPRTRSPSVGSGGYILFSDPATRREAVQWRQIYAELSLTDPGSQLFANFGGLMDPEPVDVEPDTTDLIRRIADQLAMEVYGELKDAIPQFESRGSRTSQGQRTQPRPSRGPGQIRAPVVTPMGPRGGGIVKLASRPGREWAADRLQSF